MSEEKKIIINKKDSVACNYFEACDYFKNMKRLEQELDIKEKMLDKFMTDSGKTLEKLQKENEKLKEKIDIYENSIVANHDRAVGKRLMEVLQALEEIKEISKQCMTKDLCSIDCDYADRCYIEDAEVPTYDICKLIIEKINEVLNDRN